MGTLCILPLVFEKLNSKMQSKISTPPARRRTSVNPRPATHLQTLSNATPPHPLDVREL